MPQLESDLVMVAFKCSLLYFNYVQESVGYSCMASFSAGYYPSRSLHTHTHTWYDHAWDNVPSATVGSNGPGVSWLKAKKRHMHENNLM